MVTAGISNWLKSATLLIVVTLISSEEAQSQVAKADSSNFVLMSLPRGVEILVPRGWKVFGQQWTDAFKASAETGLNLAGIELPSGKQVVLFAANSVPSGTFASIRISSVMPPSMSVAEIASLTPTDLRQLRAESLSMWQQTLATQKASLISLHAVTVQTLAGHQALITEYRRSSGLASSPVKVQVNQIFTPTQEIMLTLSYREDEASLWLPVLSKIRASLRLSRQ